MGRGFGVCCRSEAVFPGRGTAKDAFIYASHALRRVTFRLGRTDNLRLLGRG